MDRHARERGGSSTQRGDTRSIETITVSGRLLRARGVSLFFLLVVASALVTLRAGGNALERMNYSNLGLSTDFGLLVLGSTHPGTVAVGDRVVAWEGVPLTDLDDWNDRERHVASGSWVRLRVSRDGVEREVRLQAAGFSPLLRLSYGVRCIVGSALLAMGLVTFLLKPGGRAVWLFLGLCTSLAFVLLGNLTFVAFHARNVTS